ncbi:MAG: LacI family transcriptional regulator [Cypionkella sp.]|nr:LacI family transcriptional regulator [Cypionkella sp.]
MTQRDTPNFGGPRPTLKTIAAETGLAVATVSRALSNAPDIGEATKVRVRAAALKLGYRPNRAGVRLRTGKTNVIALVLSAQADVMNNTAKLLYAIADTLRGTPYHLVVMPYFPDQDPLDPVKYLVETGSADGIIFNQTKAVDARIAYLCQNQIPFATHGRSDMGLEHPYFDYDNHAFGSFAIQALAARGCRHVYGLVPPHDQMYAQHMMAGMQEMARKTGMTLELAQDFSADSLGAMIEAAITTRWQAANPPDALISSSTTGAMAAVAALERMGLRTGQDFQIVSKEAISFLHRFRRDIIVAAEDVDQAGRSLARAVMDAIEGRPASTGQRLQVPQLADFKTGD